jgi:hypothetical protein
MSQAFFGRPERTLVRGGAHVAVYVVPVFAGQLIAFDVTAPQARGRWLPWTVLGFGQNPYEAAAGLADHWCGGRITDLGLVDVMSFEVDGSGWELAIVFRAELSRLPEPEPDRAPHVFEPGHFDAIGRFDPVDLERWVLHSRAPAAAVDPSAPAADAASSMIF